MPPPGQCLCVEDLQLLNLLPVTHSDQHVVLAQLEDTIETTGVPCAILGDHGSDLHAGVNRFCQAHSETRNLYDITHKAATLMKARLEKNEVWKSFCHQAGQTKFQTQQTELSFLVPPSQRSKAKYMNLGGLVRWGRETLRLIDAPPPEVLRHVSCERLEQKLGWLRTFRDELKQWTEYQDLADASVDQIRRHGYSQSAEYQTALRLTPLLQTPSGLELKDELLSFITQESSRLQPGERLPGSSEVMESALGKLKSVCGEHQTGGFTSLLLSLGALVGRLDRDTIYDALVTVPWKQVGQWVETHLGQTHQSKRREAYRTPVPTSATKRA